MKSLLQGKERSAKRARKEKDESNSGAPLSPQLLAHLNEHFGTDLSEDSLLSFDEPTSPHRQWDSPAREQVPIRSEKPSCPPPGNYGSPKPSPFLPNESLGVSETLTPRRRKHSRRASISRNFDMVSLSLSSFFFFLPLQSFQYFPPSFNHFRIRICWVANQLSGVPHKG